MFSGNKFCYGWPVLHTVMFLRFLHCPTRTDNRNISYFMSAVPVKSSCLEIPTYLLAMLAVIDSI
jgi:hypothetical protein